MHVQVLGGGKPPGMDQFLVGAEANKKQTGPMTGKSILLICCSVFLASADETTKASLFLPGQCPPCSCKGAFFPPLVLDGRTTGTWERFVGRGFLTFNSGYVHSAVAIPTEESAGVGNLCPKPQLPTQESMGATERFTFRSRNGVMTL